MSNNLALQLKILELALYATVCLSGLRLLLQDLRTQSVTFFPLLSFFASCLCLGIINANFAVIPISVFSIIGIVFYFWKKIIAFGSADYIVVTSISFLITNEQSTFFIILCGVFGILLSIILHKYKIPFIPAILMSTLTICLLK